MKRKLLRYVVLPLAALLLIGQFIRPARTNPPVDPKRTVDAYTSVPPEVRAIFQRSCFDCHSNQTRWPWYSNVAPASWLVVSDVNEARGLMNFSEWDKRAGRRSGPEFGQICERLQERDMPLFYYLWLHPRARPSSTDVEAICSWTDAAQKNWTQGHQ